MKGNKEVTENTTLSEYEWLYYFSLEIDMNAVYYRALDYEGLTCQNVETLITLSSFRLYLEYVKQFKICFYLLSFIYI